MIRHGIIALACMAASGATWAQVGNTGQGPVTSSSVTLFGVVDVALAYGHGSIDDLTRLASGGNSSSRLGVRTFEDLGGGLAAGAWLEMGVSVDSGNGQASNSNNQASGAGTAGGLTFNRRSTVSLIGTDWGELRLGRDYVATFRNRDQVDPFGTNGVGDNQADAGTIAGITATRASNIIGYFLPAQRLGGFFGEAQYYLGENPSNSDGAGWQARLGYGSRVWGLALAAGRTRYAQTATGGDVEVWNVAGHWDFGWTRFTAGYYHDQVDSTARVKGTGYLVGAVIPVGVSEIKIAFSSYGTDEEGDPTTRKLAIGYVYNLSKRTAAYATYAHVDNHGPAAVGLNGSVTAPGRNSDGLDIGLRHSF